MMILSITGLAQTTAGQLITDLQAARINRLIPENIETEPGVYINQWRVDLSHVTLDVNGKRVQITDNAGHTVSLEHSNFYECTIH